MPAARFKRGAGVLFDISGIGSGRDLLRRLTICLVQVAIPVAVQVLLLEHDRATFRRRGYVCDVSYVVSQLPGWGLILGPTLSRPIFDKIMNLEKEKKQRKSQT